MKENFCISFWNYVWAGDQKGDEIDVWKDLGFNAAMSGECNGTDGEDETLGEVLSRADAEDFSIVVSDQALWLRSFRKAGEKEYRAKLRSRLAKLKGHASARYLMISDEPTEADLPDVYRMCELIREESDEVKPFVALNHRGGFSEKSTEKYLNEYLDKSGIDFLLYNCYSQTFENKSEREQGLENYFRNLRVFSDTARMRNVPLWVSANMVRHWMFRDIDRYLLRWQLNMAAAYGAKGVYWFHPYEILINNFSGMAIDLFGQKTPDAYYLSYENKAFMQSTARRLDGCSLEKTVHVFRSYGGGEIFCADTDRYVKDIRFSTQPQPLVLSEFKNENGKRLIMVVNASQEHNVGVEIVPYGDKRGAAEYLLPGGAMFFEIDE